MRVSNAADAPACPCSLPPLATWYQAKKRWPAPRSPADCERRQENPDETKAVPRTAVQRLLSRRDIPLREKDPAADAVRDRGPRGGDPRDRRAGLDPDNRQATIRSKGGAIQWVYWDTGTAHLLPR